MKNLILIVLFALLLTACQHVVAPADTAPSIIITDKYGNDAIDATIEYRIDGACDETYLLVDGTRIETGFVGTKYIGIFPARSTERYIVAANGTAKTTAVF